jgi:hypothetical protein
MNVAKRCLVKSEPSRAPKRRRSNAFVCGGQCGTINCNYIGNSRSDLDVHLGKYKTQCPVCKLVYCKKSNMYSHFRLKHPHLIKVHGIPNQKKLKCPNDLLPYKVEFFYLKRKILACMFNDIQKLKQMKEYVKTKGPTYETYKQNIPHYESMVEYNDEMRHKIATQWIRRLIETKRIRNQFVHESGLRMRYLFQEHGGLFQFSMDRINDNYPHFYGAKCAFTNIRDAPLCINLRHNPLNYCIERNFVEEAIDRYHHPRSLDTNTLARSEFVFRRSAKRAYFKDKKLLVNAFPTSKDYTQYCFELAQKQEFKCAVSGIVPINGKPSDLPGIDKLFQWSLNAIDPPKGHIAGNIEWVCYCFNPVNQDKTKKIRNVDDPPSSWTKELWASYSHA